MFVGTRDKMLHLIIGIFRTSMLLTLDEVLVQFAAGAIKAALVVSMKIPEV